VIGGGEPSEGWNPFEWNNPGECSHLPIVFLQRSNVVDPGECLPCIEYYWVIERLIDQTISISRETVYLIPLVFDAFRFIFLWLLGALI
jgi:hypothetical protein